MSKPSDVNADDFEKEVIKSELPVLVDFWAPWCGPCQMMAPILEELAEEMKDKVKICKLNTDEPSNQELAMKYQISSIPNMKLFKGGEVIADFVGFRPKDVLQEELEAKI